MDRILGLDSGTNSIGWCVIERDGQAVRLLFRGVHVFQEGVKKEKGNEQSRAAERTMHRSTRIHYFRRRLRKIETLLVLSAYKLCPPISVEIGRAHV